jgi:hypothetical protein
VNKWISAVSSTQQQQLPLLLGSPSTILKKIHCHAVEKLLYRIINPGTARGEAILKKPLDNIWLEYQTIVSPDQTSNKTA